MIKSIQFNPAYDNGPDDYNGNVVRFILLGDLGCIHFVLFTNWHLDHVDRRNGGVSFPKPVEVGYFSLFKPLFEGQPKDAVCKYLNYAKCYYDGVTSEADEAFDLLKTQGDEAVWRFLEIKYKQKLGELI